MTEITLKPESIHTVPTDPGMAWVPDAIVAIDAPPDSETDPLPEAQWPRQDARAGVYGAVTPNVVARPGGGYRMYYTQILPRPGFPAGANDYDNATTRILSAVSPDGSIWTPEAGVRLSPSQDGADVLRVVSPEVVPIPGAGGRLRMYYESCTAANLKDSTLRSAVCDDAGLAWTPEPGVRLGGGDETFIAPRVVFLDDGRCRLYAGERGRGVVSAVSTDGGITFTQEPGVRIEPDGPGDAVAPFATEILRIEGAGYRMYYAQYSTPNRATIHGAVSDDGLVWRKDMKPAIAPRGTGFDAVKSSEMCLMCLPGHDGQPTRYRMFYEACDGTCPGARGVWRIVSATTVD
jgi:hypothetical protein